jgi:hypothetical protein
VHGHNTTSNIIDGKSEALVLGNRLYIEPGAYRGAEFVIVAI